MNISKFKTGIPELDEMLGIEKNQDEEIYNRIILIKGGPGSGKTTLGLQILHNHLKRNAEESSVGTPYVACYVSLEVDSEMSSKYASDKFKFSELTNKKNNFYKNNKKELVDSLVNFYNPNNVHLPRLSDVIFDCLKNSDGVKLSREKTNEFKLVFVDSLNVLIDTIRSVVSKEVNERDIIKSICEIDFNSAQENNKEDDEKNRNTVFIFSVEYHPDLGKSKMEISESFMCDTEILLSVEPIFAAKDQYSHNISSIGYKIEGNDKGQKVNEYRSFCRVLKTRFDNHQIRRCSYDIESETGLKFYESFPGDGHVSFFYENTKQKDAWQSFFIEDIPHQFPALRHENFDRKQMQQNFSNRRRFMKVPEKTDLYLSSNDNYWIHWFMSVDQKNLIRDFIHDESKVFSECIKSLDEETKDKFKKQLEEDINRINNFFTQDIFKFNEIKDKEIAVPDEFILNLNTTKGGEILENIRVGNSDFSFVSPSSIREQIEIKCTEINNVKEIAFTLTEGGEIVDVKIPVGKDNYDGQEDIYSVLIVQNQKGSILILRNNQEIKNIVVADAVHQKIRFKVDNNDFYLVFDVRYHTVYRSVRAESFNSVVVNLKNSSVFKEFESIESYEFLVEKDNRYSTSNKIIAKILNQFYIDKVKGEIQEILNVLFSTKGLKCIACNCLNNLYYHQEYDDSGYMKKKIGKQIVNKRKNNYCAQSFSCLNTDTIKDVSFDYEDCYWYKTIQQIIDNDLDNQKEKNIISSDLADGIKSEIAKNIDNSRLSAKKVFESIKFNHYNEKYNLNYREADLKADFANLYLKLLYQSEQKSFLTSIEKSKLKIFGERKSEFIKELINWDYTNGRPIHCSQSLFGLFDKDIYKSIPYNANVGVFVYRKDILREFYTEIEKSKESKKIYVDRLVKIYQDQKSAFLKVAMLKYPSEIAQEISDEVKKIEEIVCQSIINLYPKTWEEIFAIYDYYRMKNKKMDLVLDVKNTDTYYCTFLELLWNSGGNFNVKADYSFKEDKSQMSDYLLRAYILLAYMYYSDILPEDSTVQPVEFAKKYNVSEKQDWIFGRFWYSTFIELFNTKQTGQDGSETDAYIWHPSKKNELGLMPMPVTLSKYLNKENPNEVEHCTAWGDWHLGIIQGSENMKLGKEIMNHLLSSRKVIESAYNNAILPTTEEFYKLFKNTNCFNPSKRDESNIVMPNSTYKEIRYKYFRHAQSRSQIYDYRHCMVELNTVLKYIENSAIRDKNDSKYFIPTSLPDYIIREIKHLLGHAIEGITKNLIKLDNN